MTDFDHIFRAARDGDATAARELVALLYDELRELARREMARERSDHTLQPTALVNEAFVRLIGGREVRFADRESFFAAAATAIRRVLVDHARRRNRQKRGGHQLRVPLDGLDVAAPLNDEELLALDDALGKLASLDPTKARLVELRFFAGFSIEQLVQTLGISESTVRREWRLARAWLRSRMEPTESSEDDRAP